MLKGSRMTLEQKQRVSEGMRKAYGAGWVSYLQGKPGTNLGKTFSPEHRKRLSESMRGIPKSEEHKAKLALIGTRNFNGGKAAEMFADVLIPEGFVREHHVVWAKGQPWFRLDFANVDGKINIELDGPYHKGGKDAARDSILRALGWRIIRIVHGRER